MRLYQKSLKSEFQELYQESFRCEFRDDLYDLDEFLDVRTPGQQPPSAYLAGLYPQVVLRLWLSGVGQLCQIRLTPLLQQTPHIAKRSEI